MEIKHKLKKEQWEIMQRIGSYLEANPQIRFGQALFNLNVNQFADPVNPERADHRLRDIHSDTDKDILKRMI